MLVGRLAYSVGIAFPPNWMQRMGVDVLPGSQRVLQAGMVFHWLMILVRLNEINIATSSTIVVTENGYEDLTPGMDRGPVLIS
jgi:Xaa-Pro dipeptidase